MSTQATTQNLGPFRNDHERQLWSDVYKGIVTDAYLSGRRDAGREADRAVEDMRKREAAPSPDSEVPTVPSGVTEDGGKCIRVDEAIQVSDLAHQMGLKAPVILRQLWSMGMRGIMMDHAIDAETAELVADAFGYTVVTSAQRTAL